MLVELDETPDKEPAIFILYTAEQKLNPDDPNIYLWLRRAELFRSVWGVFDYMQNTLSLRKLDVTRHELFHELYIITDERDHKWYMERANLHAYAWEYTKKRDI